ncbi:hypothetical protein KQI74_15065 [Paenibacillus barcinonensis]|uniref:hypothetical protein n=1 Tax=Paenibacillus barcinonensis TaxID=198119 RepID=UPI0016427138|nr:MULTISPECIES: hypothetical protein [Paenibacillus]MBU5353612.1 hypothetical protein [Paenibacillus barcinonensis]
MSSVGVEVGDVMEKVAGEETASVLDSQVGELDGAEVDLGLGLGRLRSGESNERSLSSNVKRKEDTVHECSFCCTCWTDE